MNHVDTQIGVLRTEVARLRTTTSRQRLALLALALVVGGYTLLGMTQSTRDATFDTITCKGWKVVDDTGKVRLIAAAASSDGSAGFSLLDANDRKRVEVSMAADRSAGVQWFDADGALRIRALTNADKQGMVAMFDGGENKRLLAGTDAKLGATIGLNGRTNKSAAILAIGEDDHPSLVFTDTEGKSRIFMTANPKTAKVEIKDGSAQTRIMAGVTMNNAILGLLDNEGKTRVSSAVMENGVVVHPLPDGK